jgi:hypothetical protein
VEHFHPFAAAARAAGARLGDDGGRESGCGGEDEGDMDAAHWVCSRKRRGGAFLRRLRTFVKREMRKRNQFSALNLKA